jgi:hypothetical protein
MTKILLDAPPIIMKSGDEQIMGTDKTLLDFWRWGFSDVLNNTTRGIFAEYLVASALGIATSPRITWDPYDLTYNGITIEVKSCAYIQSWKQQKASKISFDIRMKQLYDAYGKPIGEPRRHADVYIFCLLHHTDRTTINPLDVSQWEFYLLPTGVINAKVSKQESMALSTIIKLSAERLALHELRARLEVTCSYLPQSHAFQQ